MKVNNMVKPLLLNNESNVIKLNNAKPNEIDNPLGKVTVGATLFTLVQVVVFSIWFYWSYNEYSNWYYRGGKLPDNSIVKVGIPLFIVSILIEFIIGKFTGNSIEQYRLSDTIASFSNGLIQQLIELWTTYIGELFQLIMITAIPYKWIYENYGVTRMFEGNFIGFIFMVFARDLGYYWFHRSAHRSAFMWAVHGCHHLPNSFSYHVNLCQGGIQRITSALFYAPLALFCPPELYIIIFPMEKIYGFFTHTCLVGKSHWLLSSIFVTPSSHRVHHAGAPSKYIDKNYGEMLSIWDRIFGTHQDEEESIVFGHCDPFDSWNPIEAQLIGWKKIIKKSKTTNSYIDKLLCFVMPPGWDPVTNTEFDLSITPLKYSTPYNSKKYDSRLPTSFLKCYVIGWFLPTLVLSIYLIRMYKQFSNVYEIIMVFSFIMYSLFCFGIMSDCNPRSIIYDSIRLMVTPIVVYKLPLVPLVNSVLGIENTINSTIIVSLFSGISFFILLSHSNQFIVEKQLQKENRIWIKEIGRDYTNKLIIASKNASSKSD